MIKSTVWSALVTLALVGCSSDGAAPTEDHGHDHGDPSHEEDAHDHGYEHAQDHGHDHGDPSHEEDAHDHGYEHAQDHGHDHGDPPHEEDAHDHGHEHAEEPEPTDEHGHAHPEGDEHPHGGHDAHQDSGHGHEGGNGSVTVTSFTGQTQVFAEFPAMIVGAPPVIAAVHMTHREDWSPASAGTVTVELSGNGAPLERFSALPLDRPGIFRVPLAPTHAGPREARILFETDGNADVHGIGILPVFGTQDAADAATPPGPETPGAISFLMEQQWLLPFGIEAVSRRRIRPSFSAYGTLRARAEGEVHITVPVSGRLTAAPLPILGTEVAAGELLAVLTPSLGNLGDGAAFLEATLAAQLELEQTLIERARLEKLLEAGVIPQKRVIDIRFAEKRARARLEAAESRQSQRRGISNISGRGGKPLELRSPIDGIIVKVGAPSGSWVPEGTHLFHVVNLDELWLEVQVSEAHVTALDRPHGAWFTVEGIDEPFELGPEAMVATGGVVDEHTRTIPLVLRVTNADRRLRVGMFADVNVLLEDSRPALTVPVSAIVYQGGLPMVYVLVSGESFVRRQVKLGDRDGRHIEVASGIELGDHVVSRGAYAVRLASAAGQLPAHGHHH